MIRVTDHVVIYSRLLPGSLHSYEVWIEVDGYRTTECGVTSDPHALEERAERAVRAHLGLSDRSTSELAGDLGAGLFSACVRVAVWMFRGLSL